MVERTAVMMVEKKVDLKAGKKVANWVEWKFVKKDDW